jgi:hypothetical protein
MLRVSLKRHGAVIQVTVSRIHGIRRLDARDPQPMSILKLFRVRFSEPTPPLPERGGGEHVRLTNPWHAVSVVPGTTCCSGARELAGKRYLSSEAPPALPLKGCPMIACTCRYRHHDDRRGRSTAMPQRETDGAPKRRAEDAPAH